MEPSILVADATTSGSLPYMCLQIVGELLVMILPEETLDSHIAMGDLFRVYAWKTGILIMVRHSFP